MDAVGIIDGFLGFFAMVYAATFSPRGYTYAQGEWVGFITEVEKRGYIWKTWEGSLKTDPHPNQAAFHKYKWVSMAEKKDFSIEDDYLRKQLIGAMVNRQLVVIHYHRIGYFMPYWHGDSRAFAKKVYVFKEKN